MHRQFTPAEVYAQMEATGMGPVFFSPDLEIARNVIKACYDAGVRVFEFTNRGAGALDVFRALVPFVQTELPGLILGVGSISFAKDARDFIKAGANFVVGPQWTPDVCRVCRCRKMPYIPGCGTVSEVGRAQRSGSEICKIFPGDVLGPAFVKALRAPMPWSRILVTGGVKPTEENLRAWFAAGVCCVGMGSNLFPKDAIAALDWNVIKDLCANSLEIIKKIKGYE